MTICLIQWIDIICFSVREFVENELSFHALSSMDGRFLLSEIQSRDLRGVFENLHQNFLHRILRGIWVEIFLEVLSKLYRNFLGRDLRRIWVEIFDFRKTPLKSPLKIPAGRSNAVKRKGLTFLWNLIGWKVSLTDFFVLHWRSTNLMKLVF